jgi:hypothetical protein
VQTVSSNTTARRTVVAEGHADVLSVRFCGRTISRSSVNEDLSRDETHRSETARRGVLRR